MIENTEELKKFLESLKEEDIKFKDHFYKKKEEDRNYLDENFIIENVKKSNNLLGFQKQVIRGEERYRIGFDVSNKYKLVVVATIDTKNLYILTAWKTNRKWQKSIQK